MYKRFGQFIKTNKRTSLVFLFALISLFISNIVRNSNGSEIFGWLRLWKYLSLIVGFFTLYLLFIKLKRTIFANLTLLCFLLIGVETILFFVLGMPSAFKKDFSIPKLESDNIFFKLGTFNHKDTVINDTKIVNGDTVFNVTYSFDQYRRRITPNTDINRKNYNLFFGCSIGFGYGLNDNQTLAYHFQNKDTTANSYNYCVSSTGTNHMLAKLQYEDISKQVKEKNGKAFYIFFWDHIYRSIGCMSRYTEWLHLSPNYEFEGKKLVRNKRFKDGRPIKSWFYESVYQTNIVKYFQADFPLRLNDSHFDLVTEMILESKKEYEKQFGNDEFFVVIYPNYINYTPEEMKKFQFYLKNKEIKFLDLSMVIKYQSKYTLGGDSHPNSETNKLISMLLYKKLQEYK